MWTRSIKKPSALVLSCFFQAAESTRSVWRSGQHRTDEYKGILKILELLHQNSELDALLGNECQVALATVDLKAVNSSGGLIHLAQLSKATLVWSYWSDKFIHDPRFVTCSLSLFFRPCERTGRVVSWDWKVLTQLCISFFSKHLYKVVQISKRQKVCIYIL